MASCSGGGGEGGSSTNISGNANPPSVSCSNGNAASAANSVITQIDWSSYGGDVAGSKYKPVGRIDRDNFLSLEVKWTWCSPDQRVVDANPGVWPGHNESTPILVDGVLYTSTSLSQAAAIDPLTGGTVWEYDPQSYTIGSPPNLGYVNRGVSYWSDGSKTTIFLATGDGRLIGLDAGSGIPDASFAIDGFINLRLGLRRGISSRYYGISSPPAVCNNTIVIGSSVLDFPAVTAMPPGDVRGFDADSGALKWIFKTIPQLGEPGNATWENDSWRDTGGANVWTTMSCDESLGLVYLPVSTPTNDYYGGDRLGDNLFAETLVAVDVETGSRAWSFQVIHHGLWDYDLPAAPNLIDIVVNGQAIPAVAQVSKQAFTYVFDRRDGTPVWPIVEQPVDVTSNVQGERPAATQPIPTKPAPFDRQGLVEDNLIDFTPALRSQASAIARSWNTGPLFTPPSGQGTIALPGIIGGASWSGAAVHPTRGYLYVPSITQPFVLDANPSAGTFVGRPSPGPQGPQGLPLIKPPYGRVTAIDLNTGEHLWVAPVGEGIEQDPALAGLGLSGLGLPLRSFVLATDTLLFVVQEGVSEYRGSSDRQNADTFVLSNRRPSLRAYDLDTGELIGQVSLPGNATGSPMTYVVNDRQYIVVPIGGSLLPAHLVTLGLP